MRQRVLVVDDESGVREVARLLLAPDYDITEAADPATALRLLLSEVPDVLLTDLVMPTGSGIDLARQALQHLPDLAVIVMTGLGSLPNFVESFRVGVADFLPKPFNQDELKRCIARSLETRRARAENALLRTTLAARDPLSGLVGESEAMRLVRQRVRQVAGTDATVLVTGSSGTGKEVVAGAIHVLSPRRAAPFVAVHCGALPAGLIESELFGHARGAFTGAHAARMGRFEEASGGTVFLDEIGTMPEATQVRLLRVLQEGRVTRVGESVERPVDVRVVAATNEDLPALVGAGRFREDLFYRLDVVAIHLPDLANRLEDVTLLASHFLERTCERMRRPRRTLSQEAARRLVSHRWPGNVRELENVIEAAVILSGDRDSIEPDDVLVSAGASGGGVELPPDGMDLARFLDEAELELVRQALERTDGSIPRAAELLHASRSTIARRVKAMGDGGKS